MRASYLEEWFEPPDWSRTARYIQISERPDEIWEALPTEVAVVGSCGPVLTQMIECVKGLGERPGNRDAWLHRLQEVRDRFKVGQRAIVDRYRATEPIHPSADERRWASGPVA